MEELAALAAISLASGFILFSSSRDAILRTKHQIRLQRRTSIEVFDSRVEEAVDAKKGLETAAATARKISTVVDPEKIKQSTEVYHALSRLREFVIRDFIDSWYRAAVSTNDDFPNQVRMAIDYAFAALAERLLKVDWAAVIVNEAISFFTDLLRYVRLTEEELLKVQEYKKAKAHDRLRLLLVEIRRKYSLHKGVDNPTDYLRKFSDDLLKSIMRESDFKCMSARTLVREVFTMNIFTPVLGFASSDFINRMISLVASKLRSAKFEDDEELDQESDGDESDHTMHSEIEKELESPVSSSKEENPFPDAVSPTEQASGLIETANFNAELSSPELESTSTFKADIIKWKYSWDIHKPYAVYFLRLSNDSLSWTLRKRFSHFIDLHSELQKTVPSFKAKFPRRNLFQFLDSMSSEFLDQRLRDLNKYLHEGIMFDSKCTDSAAWRRFISPGNDPVVEIEEQGEKQISNMTNGAQKRRSNDEFPVESQIDAADTKVSFRIYNLTFLLETSIFFHLIEESNIQASFSIQSKHDETYISIDRRDF